MAPPLAGLRLVDLSRQLPGPFCSMLLADLGMEVLAVAAPDDPMGSPIPILMRNKRSMTLNLKHPEGKAIFQRLVAGADALLEGFRPGVVERLGIDYPSLARANAGLVYCSLSGYGQDGPYRDRVGHDINYLAYGGVLDLTGTVGGPPVVPGVQVADIGGGALMAAVGILAALLARGASGRGQFVDVAMLDGVVAWQVVHAFGQLAGGRAQERGATVLTGRYPCYAIYETRDRRYLTIGALEPHFWRTLCVHLGHPELIGQQFAEGAEGERAFAVLRDTFRRQTLAEWARELADLEVCFGPVQTVAEMLDDPQVRARGMVTQVPRPGGGGELTLGAPIRFSATPAELRTPAVGFGEHTEAVLEELGYTRAEIRRLRAEAVI